MSVESLNAPGYLILWGLIATVAMTSILEGSRGLGFSRMSLPFLVGSLFVGSRRWALILGFTLYTIGGWLFAFLYYLLFASVGIYTWWFGALAGLLHGIFLLVSALPLLPFVHPRMASEYHGATGRRRGAAGFSGKELWAWNAADNPAGADCLWRDPRRILTTARRYHSLDTKALWRVGSAKKNRRQRCHPPDLERSSLPALPPELGAPQP